MLHLKFLSFFLFGSVSAQYFSAGWSPGKPVDNSAAEAWASNQPPPIADVQHKPPTSNFGFSKILTSGPLGSLLAAAGINLTQTLDDVTGWDKRIPMITDDNYDDIIVNESLTEQEEKDRVWFLIITVARGQSSSGYSQSVDRTFDSAYNLTTVGNDLPNVRWGRIDYIDVTALTTKWAVWQAPRLVVLIDRGRTLRFFDPRRGQIEPEFLREWLKNEDWRDSDPWASAYAPGGSREWLIHYFAIALAKYYNVISRIPKWLLLIVSGSVGSIMIGFFHRNPPPQPTRALPTGLKPVSADSTQPDQASTSKLREPSRTPNKSKRVQGRKGKND